MTDEQLELLKSLLGNGETKNKVVRISILGNNVTEEDDEPDEDDYEKYVINESEVLDIQASLREIRKKLKEIEDLTNGLDSYFDLV